MLARQVCDAHGDTAHSVVSVGRADPSTSQAGHKVLRALHRVLHRSPPAIPSVPKENQEQTWLRQLPPEHTPTSEGFAQPGAISVVPALPRERERQERRNSQSPPPAPQDQLWQLFPIEPGTALQEKNREQKVGENPSFQGKEGNDQENRKVSLVPNTRRPDLTPPHCPLPDRSARAGHSFPGTAWHGGPSPSLFLRRDPRTPGRAGLRALCSPRAQHLPGAGAPPAAGPLAGLTALAHVAAGANNGMALGCRARHARPSSSSSSPQRALPATGSWPLSSTGGRGIKKIL